MRALVVSPGIPFPPIDGAGRRTNQLLRALAERHEVTLIVLEHTAMGRFLPQVEPTCPVGLDTHNVHARIAERSAKLDPDQRDEADRHGASNVP